MLLLANGNYIKQAISYLYVFVFDCFVNHDYKFKLTAKTMYNGSWHEYFVWQCFSLVNGLNVWNFMLRTWARIEYLNKI